MSSKCFPLLAVAICFTSTSPAVCGENEEARTCARYLTDDLPTLVTVLVRELNAGPIAVVLDMEFGHRSPEPSARAHLRVTMKREGVKYLYMTEAIDGIKDLLQGCQSYNGRYYFELKKNPKDNAWLLGRFEETQTVEPNRFKSKSGEYLIQTVDENVGALANTILFADGVKSLADIPKLPGFKTIKFARDQLRERTEINFIYNFTDKQSKRQGISTCELIVVTDGVLPSYKLTQNCDLSPQTVSHVWQRGWTKQGKNRYLGTGTLEVVRKIKEAVTTTISQKSTHTVNTRPIPVTEFTLSAFGFPEPLGVTWERPTPTYVWLLLVTAVLGVVAVGCRWLLKRRAKAVPPPVPPTPST